MPEPRADWFENAVLVYGPRKSGTTLLHNLLDGGRDMFVYPEELKLKRLARSAEKGEIGNEEYRDRLRTLKVELPAFDADRYAAAWNTLVAAGGTRPLKKLIWSDLQFVMESVRVKLPSTFKAWCAKEVGGDTRAVIGWWLQAFDAPRVVFILRNPLMVTRAVLNDRRRKGRRLSIRAIVRETLDPIKVLKAQQALAHRSEILTITYENLVSNPTATVARIAAFLNIENGAYLTLPTIFGEAVVVRTASKPRAAIFDSGANWQDGLTLRERAIVRAASLWARLTPQLRLDYAALVASVPDRK